MELSNKINAIATQIGDLSAGQKEMQDQVNQLYTAFTGNKLGQKGVIPRVEMLEIKVENLTRLKAKMVGIGMGAATVWTVFLEFLKHKLNLQ